MGSGPFGWNPRVCGRNSGILHLNRDDRGWPSRSRRNLQSCDKRNISREYRLRCELPRKPCSGEPPRQLKRRICTSQQKRNQTWRVEAVREWAVHYPAHGIGRIQTSFGLGGPGGCYIHSDSEARMGCGSRRRAGGKRWRIRAYIAELFVTVQQPITAYFRSFCMRTEPEKRTACAARRPLASRRTPITTPDRPEGWRIL